MARPISASTVTANSITAPQVNTQRLTIGGFRIEAAGDGLFVTTPDGIRLKVELIDFRETPIPETAPLRLAPEDENTVPEAIAAPNAQTNQ